MDLEYDRKFEEMKKYIPFLESMIKRLESTNNGVKNPRKAQLDKIRSLRDLLLDKKKRMKMENLLKCEQVLVNLYAKVEQRDSMTDNKEDCTEKTQKDKSDLNMVRNKLKSVVSKLQDDVPETLPEIARATNTEVVCTPGSKEPALFQRRPNKASPVRGSSGSHKDDHSNSKRHYTRVLMSPDHKKKDWLVNSDTNNDTPLFSRRSPRRSPRRHSPSYKRERKKSSKQRSKSSQDSKDLNITLKVPEESLGSLNTKDILSRIINCSDSDVDIDTLRGLRSQILGELKQTGTKDDISDLILKSYKKKEKSSKKTDEVEEGELSDSESETIENIYGSLVVVDKSESDSNSNKISSDKKQPRKIQICLVINSEKEKEDKVNDQTLNTTLDITDFEAYTDSPTASKASSKVPEGDKTKEESISKEVIEKENNIALEEKNNTLKILEGSCKSPKQDDNKIEKTEISPKEKPTISSTDTFKPNFYQSSIEEKKNTEESSKEVIDDKSEVTAKPTEVLKNPVSSAKIKRKTEVVSEIDILQALKKEILGETGTVPIPEVITPPLHQPKITKVASAHEIMSKKRISIENYKQKSVPSIKQPLFKSAKQQSSIKDDNLKKQSLKLTEKECERFNFPVNVSPVDSSEDEDKQKWDHEQLHGAPKSPDPKNKENSPVNFETHRGGSAPKSPDHEDFADTGIRPPVIIPSDPVKNIVPNTKVDIDMRTLMPLISPITVDGSRKSIPSPSLNCEKVHDATWNENSSNNEKNRKSVQELRMRAESNQPIAKNSPNSYVTDSDRGQRPGTSYANVPANISSNIPPLMSLNPNPNILPNLNQVMPPLLNSPIPLLLNPNMTPNMTPTLNPILVSSMNPNMTPSRMIPNINPMMTPIVTPNSRSYEMTPRPNFDVDDYTNQKHVYAPMLPPFDPHDFSEKDSIQANQSNESTKWEDRNCRNMSVQRDVDYHRNRNDRFTGDRLDSPQIRMECPATPNTSFGRMDCPSTPNPSFGRIECPSTPNPSFGRMECPSTPNPSFGRIETPMTPVHSFGRSDCPMTPSHPFGRSDSNMTPANVFGRDYHHGASSYNHNYIKSHDPRLNRSNDYDKYHSRSYDERNQSYFEDDHKMIDNANRYRRNHVKPYEQDNHNNRGRMLRRETSVGRSVSRDYETDESYNEYYYRRENYKYSDDLNNERNYRSKSIGRINSPLRERGQGKKYTKEESMEKPISVQSHTGRSFNIDTSFNRTFQENKSTSSSFNARRQRASSVGRSLCESPRKDCIDRISNKNDFFHVSERKTLQFRRACSVGRDLKDYNANKNFKDIKDDLRSSKFSNYDFNQRERDHNSKSPSSYSSEKIGSKGHHSRRDTHVSNPTLNKSSGHQDNRDPRRKLRDCDVNSTKIDDSSKYSPRKNFRDPRMRREIDVKNTSKDRYKDKERNSCSSRYKNNGIVYSNDNIAKGTILASVSGVKNFKIPKIKRAVEEKEVENKSQNEIDVKKKESFKNVKKAGSLIPGQSKKGENKPIRSESSVAEKRYEVENNSKNIAIKETSNLDKPKSKEDITSINKISDKVQNNDENTLSVNIISDSCERRITRSAVKSGTSSKQISSTSPVKKLRRIKKPIVYDSDSDTQENESGNRDTRKSPEKELKINEEQKFEKDSKIEQNEEITSSERSNSMNEDTIITNTENNLLNIINEKSMPDTSKESREEENDTLDISFGVDDDLFSDNMASGSVLDNINALIADLDHDIEAPKINDFNDKFINNIVGRVSSNNSPIPINGNRTDVASDVVLHDNVSLVVDVQNAVKDCDAQIAYGKGETNKIEATKSENNSGHVNCLTQSNESGTQNNCEEIIKNAAEYVESSKTETTNQPFAQENVTGNMGETQGGNKTVNLDAIVSTTARDEKSDDLSNNLECSSDNSITCLSPFVPDSTINSSKTNTNVNDKDLQESIPDSTNELASEMNISSTNNSNDMPSKEQCANATCVDSLPRIDSISKLLSILEDKNKIKELLTLLSNDTGENEKIKKKLEKLSEIVSDDKDNTKDATCNIKTQSQKLHDGNLRESDDIVDEASENDNNSISVDADQKLDKESNDSESIILKTTLSDNGTQCDGEKAENEEAAKIDDKIANINKDLKENQLQTDIKIIENTNISVDVVQKTSDSNGDKEVKENETFTECKDVTDTVQEDIQISEVNVKENNLTDTLPAELKSGNKIVKKSKITKRGRSRLAKNGFPNKDKRVTRSEAGSSQPIIPPAPKKPSRELLKLQEDIRDMFISEDILNATGIRMCRLAKLVDNKNSKDETPAIEVEPEPIVVLENIKNKMPSDDSISSIEKNNKRKSKSKPNTLNDTLVDSESKQKPKSRPGPKSKTKKQDDPYIFETESIGESNNTVDSQEHDTDSDCDSVSTKSFGSAELSAELKKKPKRKRRSWQLGVIKKKGIKGKSAVKSTEFILPAAEEIDTQENKYKNTDELPDYNCFTDKSYCFYKNVKNYMCRLCGYRGNDIVPHYKKHHPHSEIPLSRLSPGIAKEAIQQCENMNLQAISKIQTLKYVCRFCFQEFHKQNSILETFFWHVVSMHTGEYKHICSECVNITRCPFNLDIPPPPKNIKGQLIGYICGRCNFTQVSLENLKTHVIIRHDDEQTEVYSINLGDIPRKVLESLITKANETSVERPRVLRSSRSNQSITEPSDRSDITDSTDHNDSFDTGRDNPAHDNITKVPLKIASESKIQSKFIFENDDSDASSYSRNDEMIKASIKLERDEDTQDSVQNNATEEALELNKELVPDSQPPIVDNVENTTVLTELTSSGVLDYPHFKIKLSNIGAKEYVCCINGLDNHYKTTLLISLKKHVQFKHSENWDGYCFVCKVIVTSQGKHSFNDCLQHFLDKHMDNFPIFEEAPVSIIDDVPEQTTSTLAKEATISKTYINVRPLSELISAEQNETGELIPELPKIQMATCLGSSHAPSNNDPVKAKEVYRYEEAQSEIMAKKHRVVLDAMLSPEKLLQVFKCAGRFCSYTTDNAEEALLHASTHQRIGGESSLKCAYCDFDSSGNAIDLVTHVFKYHNHCTCSCSKCFYRAPRSQQVYAHIKRIHPEFDHDKVPVLKSATDVEDNTPDDIISRDEAVKYYICKNKDPDDGAVCKFKTYVLTKFRNHLEARHRKDAEYGCNMCNTIGSTSKHLLHHLKSHGLRIYQCCRCYFGADSEPEMMAHASEKHPLKPPKAYLRIITKGITSESRVLPLAVLSRPNVEPIVVAPCVTKENPVKQAERSIDLEKLIGLTNLTVESMSTITNEATIETLDITENAQQIQLESEQNCESSEVEAERSSPAVLTLLRDTQDTLNEPNVIVKSEPVEKESTTSDLLPVTPISPPSAQSDPDVVCLDSDDDSSRQNIIDLSLEDTPVELNSTKKQENADIKIPRTRLYKCSKCLLVSKSEGMFKRHILSCFPDPHDIIQCAHCSFTAVANEVVVHYNSNHVESPLLYTCGLCDEKCISLPVIRKHMKITHNENSTIVKSKISPTGVRQYIVEKDFKERQTNKRKLSGDTTHRNSEPAFKLKKYGPQDVDKLPINPILDDLVYCSLCEFSTKVRLNMVRHLQCHAEQQPVARTAPVNPVPHLESNEKHFDKMVNLASSSITTSNKTGKDGSATTIEYLSPEAAAAYPKYVPDKHRYTCGAKGCSYISVNETMFKIHWETLHAGTNDYHCVHCMPHQQLNTTKPLTAVRIIAHLKMHDINLYACSSCTFYHYTRKHMEKHLKDVHSGKIIIVREGGAPLPPTPPTAQATPAPTMDLKPWQCGLCRFKSMIRPEVIEHCGKFHQSKMQFKCTYCGFRTSNIENISKHQLKQHPGKKEEVFYFYYREGSIPDEADGTARWQKQSQKTESAEIKTETDIPPPETIPILPQPAQAKPPNLVNLDIVKKEVVEPETNVSTENSDENLCQAFGQFCDPNGLKYKCSLCKVIIEDTKEAMQSHLYEELQYRKWGCAVCSYKAFHKPGLQQHVLTEHKHSREAREPIELQVDSRIETWVMKLLEHQTAIIERNKANLAKQKAEILRSIPGTSITSKVPEKPAEPPSSASKPSTSMAELEKLFGPFGVPTNMNYTCPKCNINARAEAVMQEHLEGELNKIRWCCNICNDTFQTYHEAQFHCRSVHAGQSSRPVEATRDVGLRAAWVAAVLRVQKLSMNFMPVTPTRDIPAPQTDNAPENSLLVVRYEEKVPTPEEQMKLNKKADSDEGKSATDDTEKKKAEFQCEHCLAIYKNEACFQTHVLKHYGLKPFTCVYCPHTDQKKMMEAHIKSQHPNTAVHYVATAIPSNPPVHDYLKSTSGSKTVVIDIESKIICLGCEEAMTRVESLNHFHDKVRPQFGMRGAVVYSCWTCLTLHKTSNDFSVHHKQFHPTEKKNSSFYKLSDEGRSLFCSICNQNFVAMAQYRSHQQMKHGLKSFVTTVPPVPDVVIELDDEVEGVKRKAMDSTILPVPKRVARKSTTKLPTTMAVARKSTTKLPFNVPCDDEEYTFYGTRPSMDNLENVTTLMPFYNTFVPFTLEKLSEIIKIYPVVVVKDINKQ